MMDELRDRAREGVERLGQRGRTTRIPDDVRSAVIAYVERECARGRSRREVALELGLSSSAVVRWTNGRRRARGKLMPVRVLATAAAPREVTTVRLVSPSGYRIEGLSLTDAIETLRALG